MTKLWPDAKVVPAPPMKERPRCRACGKRLKPNYNTRTEVRRFHPDGTTAQPGDDRYAYARGEYGYTERIWRGSYGLSGLFCGPKCATHWALAVCPELDKKGARWRCMKAVERERAEEGAEEKEEAS